MTDAGVDSSQRRERTRFALLVAMIVLLALALRVLYATMSQVEFPVSGDINHYVSYAWNLIHHGVFSASAPGAESVVPDSYRGPGYPFFLAAVMQISGDTQVITRAVAGGQFALGGESDRWMRFALGAQIILSALTVLLTITIARFWLARHAALCAGLLVALWPHLVSFSATLLSETLLGFLLVLSFWLLSRAERDRSSGAGAASGLVFGLAFLVNPLVAPFPVLAALALGLRSQRRLGCIFFLAFALAPVAWGVRNAQVHGGPSAFERIAQNFVQGSWPQYHAAANSRSVNPISQQIYDLILEEQQALIDDPAAGIAQMFERMRLQPGFYLSWYLFEKPFLLWDWSVRVGWGDIYFVATRNSPYERIPVLKLMEQAFKMLNPLILILAAVCALSRGFAWALHPARVQFVPAMVALFLVYVTLVHVVLQAEPRYSVAYRPEELLLATAAVAQIRRWWRQRAARRGPNPDRATTAAEPGA